MLATKKAQGLSLNTIIIAIIVLVVLVVLVMIFTGYFGKLFTPTLRSCSTQGGQCAVECTGSLGKEISGTDCSTAGEGLKCCSSVSTAFNDRTEAKADCGVLGGSCSRTTNSQTDKDCTDATGCAKKADGTYSSGCDGTCNQVPTPCRIGTSQLSAPGCEGNGFCCK